MSAALQQGRLRFVAACILDEPNASLRLVRDWQLDQQEVRRFYMCRLLETGAC